MKLHLLDLGSIEYDEGWPLAAAGVSTLSEPAPPAARRRVAIIGALICHTRGAAGAVVSGHAVGPAPVVVPAPPATEVDPTGAGDTFAAAFVTATRAGADPVSAAHAACAIAARSVAVMGAMELVVGPEDLRQATAGVTAG